MTLYIVRHGQTDWNKNNLLQGSSNIPLNEVGRKQAILLSKSVKDEQFDVCISSPLERAYETATIICDGRVNIIKDSRLKERELGELEGKSATLYDSKMYWNYSLNANSQGVECIQDLFMRITSFWDDIKSKYEDKNVLIVAHGAVVRALHYIITGYSQDTDFLLFDVPNCHMFRYEV